MAKRVCPTPGCPTLTDGGKCAECRSEADKARGSRQQRGYDGDYDARRRTDAKTVAAGKATCWRCGGRIAPGSRWHEGHDDNDRSVIHGPEHERCNLSAAGRARRSIN